MRQLFELFIAGTVAAHFRVSAGFYAGGVCPEVMWLDEMIPTDRHAIFELKIWQWYI